MYDFYITSKVNDECENRRDWGNESRRIKHILQLKEPIEWPRQNLAGYKEVYSMKNMLHHVEYVFYLKCAPFRVYALLLKQLIFQYILSETTTMSKKSICVCFMHVKLVHLLLNDA